MKKTNEITFRGVTTDSLLWHPHIEKPIKPTSAIIALDISEDFPGGIRSILRDGIYDWKSDSGWTRSRDGTPLIFKHFWWMQESDLLEAIERSNL